MTSSRLSGTLLRTAFFLGILLVCLAEALSAAPTSRSLSGALWGNVAAGDYLVTGTLTVPPGRSLRLCPGAHLYFVNFSGLEINGDFLAEGTEDSAIILSSSPDYPDLRNRETAASFDWNGVLVNKSASRVILRNLSLAYSTYGLKIESDFTWVTVRSTLFILNGQFDVTRLGRVILVPRNVPFNYDSRLEIPTVPSVPHSPKVQKKEGGALKLGVQIGLGVATLGGAALWIGGHLAAEENNKRVLAATTTAAADRAEADRAAGVLVRNIGIALTIVGAAGLTLTFIF